MSSNTPTPVKAVAERRTNLLGGRLPYWVVLGIAASMFGAGRMSVNKQVPVALAEQSAVLMRVVLDHPELGATQIERQVRAPIRDILQRYGQQGYMVVDVATNDAGGYGLLALPAGSIDITGELLAAVQTSTAAATTSAASAVAPAASATPNAQGH